MDTAVNQVMENAILQAAHQVEDQLDNQIHTMDNIGEDEIQRLRKGRMAVRFQGQSWDTCLIMF
jgi:hypothetical protein